MHTLPCSPYRWGLDPGTGEITLKRFEGLNWYLPPTSEQLRDPVRVCFVDVETTGLDVAIDTIIELATVSLLCDERTGVLFPGYHATDGDWLQDPKCPLDPVVSALTGLTSADLDGQDIPEEALDPIIDADMVVSHNASFDWRFCTKQWPRLHGKLWACSYRQVEWARWGYRVHTLQELCRAHGFWFHGHRARIDCEALAALLQRPPWPGTDEPPRYMKQLLDNARQPHYLLVARNSRYEMKEDLKRCGYRWDPDGRQWQLLCRADDVAERAEQMAELYAKWRMAVPQGCKRLVEPEQVWQHWG